MRIYLRLLVAFLLLSAGNVVYAEAQQEKRVTGTVTSEGEPLPGVSVQVKGASSGTITDIDGNYSIEAPANGTIVFRFVGLRTVEQAVNNRNVINVTMESESKELEEVMVVAYATAKKYSFTGAASTMKAGEIEKLQTSSVSRVLEGTVCKPVLPAVSPVRMPKSVFVVSVRSMPPVPRCMWLMAYLLMAASTRSILMTSLP